MRDSSLWFRHDANASKDERIVTVRQKLGREAIAVYWEIIEFLTEQPDHTYPEELLMNVVAPQDAVALRAYKELYASGLLHVTTGGRVYSRRLKNDLQKFEEICERNKENARKRWENRKVMPDAVALPPDCHRNANTIHNNTIHNNTIQSIDIPSMGSPAPQEPATPLKNKTKRAKPKTDWIPPGQDELQELYGKYGHNLVDKEIPRCKDYFAQNEVMMRDWAATRRNWMRKALEFLGKEKTHTGFQKPFEQTRPKLRPLAPAQPQPVCDINVIQKFKRDVREKGLIKTKEEQNL